MDALTLGLGTTLAVLIIGTLYQPKNKQKRDWYEILAYAAIWTILIGLPIVFWSFVLKILER